MSIPQLFVSTRITDMEAQVVDKAAPIPTLRLEELGAWSVSDYRFSRVSGFRVITWQQVEKQISDLSGANLH